MKKNSKNKNVNLLHSVDIIGELDGFCCESDRIKYMSKNYGDMDIIDAFSEFYNVPLDKSEAINYVDKIELGQCYWGEVVSISKSGITFSIPGIKDEIHTKENFNDCIDNVRNYLMNHDNKLYFEVRDKVRGQYVVSVLNGYYKLWQHKIESYIAKRTPISVHIDSLTNGGYLCHTGISTINELTGKNYTSLVFIPGSNIVLNIEHDFDRWVGQDVDIIPQKLDKYRMNRYTGEFENSLIGSRKLMLQMIGAENLHDIYQRYLLLSSGTKYTPEAFDGVVTGIINSNNKVGIFVELDNLYITGLLPLDISNILDYKPGDKVKVMVKEFEIQEGKDPFEFKNNKLIKSNTRLIFEFAA